MGNRAVITTNNVNRNNQSTKLGLYLHWTGSEGCVREILQRCKDRGIRKPSSDYSYFWARFCQIAADYVGKDETTGIGLDIMSRQDVNNGDNGVYYIDDNFDIVRHTDGKELL